MLGDGLAGERHPLGQPAGAYPAVSIWSARLTATPAAGTAGTAAAEDLHTLEALARLRATGVGTEDMRVYKANRARGDAQGSLSLLSGWRTELGG